MILQGREENGAVAALTVDAGKGNVLGTAAVGELRTALALAAGDGRVKAVLLAARGPDFSYGASVAEHCEAQVAAMLRELHALVLELVASPAPVIACVRGSCLGGGLEVALACTRIVAAPGARFAQPEIRLGVLAPAASLLLPRRTGEAAAAELLLSGAPVHAGRGLALGLVDEIADDPEAAARAFVRAHLLLHSASSLRLAHRALRAATVEALTRDLPRLERLYLEELVPTPDAREGIAAFLEKRPARWAGSAVEET